MKRQLCGDEHGLAGVSYCIAYPVECLLEFNPIDRLEAFLDSLLSKAQSPQYTVSDSEPTEHLLFVVSPKFPI